MRGNRMLGILRGTIEKKSETLLSENSLHGKIYNHCCNINMHFAFHSKIH